jgi:hypothetical protein
MHAGWPAVWYVPVLLQRCFSEWAAGLLADEERNAQQEKHHQQAGT